MVSPAEAEGSVSVETDLQRSFISNINFKDPVQKCKECFWEYKL
jgi:hypothetical protein